MLRNFLANNIALKKQSKVECWKFSLLGPFSNV